MKTKKSEISKEIEDPRRQYGNKLHKPEEIIIIGLASAMQLFSLYYL